MIMGFSHGGFSSPVINYQCRPSELQICSSVLPASTVWKSCHSSHQWQQKRFLQVQKIRTRAYSRSHLVLCSTQAIQKVTFHAGETVVTVPFSKEAAVALSNAMDTLFQTFQGKAAAEKPQRWENLEFQHSSGGTHVEIFCNPNAYANAFQAKVLMTIGDGNIKVTSEGLLSAIKSDVDQFVEMCAIRDSQRTSC